MKDNVMLHHRVSALDTLPDVTRNGRHRPRMEALLAELCLPEICQGPIRDCARAPCLCCAAALHWQMLPQSARRGDDGEERGHGLCRFYHITLADRQPAVVPSQGQ
jgi:hypothetical protein